MEINTKNIFKNNNFICYLHGGLGNQIFQYVLTLWIKNKLKKNTLFVISDYSKIKNLYRYFRKVQPLFFYDWLSINQKVVSEYFLVDRLKARINNHFVEIFKGIITNKVFLDYLDKSDSEFFDFVSESYFLKSNCVYPQLLNNKSFYPFWNQIGELCKSHVKSQSIDPIKREYDVVIHIRKGDYISYGKRVFANIDGNYYDGAIQLVKELKQIKRPKCLIIGNDINWAKENIRKDIDAYYQFESELVDFYTIANARNLILANSSFSYAAAMVSINSHRDRLIICPENYYTGKHYFGPLYNNNWLRIKN